MNFIITFGICGWLLLVVAAKLQVSKDVEVTQLNEDNWDRMLTGEWMVEL